jgi:polyisoprenoid-binding protein YceI
VADDPERPTPGRTGAATPVCYRLDPGRSRFTVQGFAGGLLSFLAHSPTFAVRNYAGELRLDGGTLRKARFEMTVRADSLELLDRVKPADREDIEGRMRHEVLESARYPEIRFEAGDVSADPTGEGQYRLRMSGRLTLHGVTNPVALDAQLFAYSDGVRLVGESPLRLSEYRIRPVTALGGAIQMDDRLRVAFDLVAWKDGRGPEGP